MQDLALLHCNHVCCCLNNHDAFLQQLLPEPQPQARAPAQPQAARQMPQQITLRTAAPAAAAAAAPPPQQPAPLREPPPPRSRRVADLLPDLPMPSRVSVPCFWASTPQGAPIFCDRQQHDESALDQTESYGCCCRLCAADSGNTRHCRADTQHVAVLCTMLTVIFAPHLHTCSLGRCHQAF